MKSWLNNPWQNSTVVLIALLGIGLLASCSRPKLPAWDRPLPDPQVLLAEVAQNESKLQDFSGSGVIEVVGKQIERAVVGIKVQYLRPDYLSLTLRGPLGIHLGQLVIAGEDYLLDLGSEGIIRQGKISQLDLPTTFGVSLQSEDLVAIFTPFIKIPLTLDSLKITASTDARYFLITFPDSGLSSSLHVDVYKPIILQLLTTSPQGDTLAFRRVEQIKQYADLYFPTQWRWAVRQGDEAYRLKIELPRLQVNTGLKATDFNVNWNSQPDSVEGKID